VKVDSRFGGLFSFCSAGVSFGNMFSSTNDSFISHISKRIFNSLPNNLGHTKINTLTPIENLNEDKVSYLKRIISTALENASIENIQGLISICLDSLSDEQLRSLLEMNESNIKETIDLQASIKDIALKSVLQTKGKAIWKEIAHEAVHFIHHLIEMLITLTGVKELNYKVRSSFRDEMSEYEARSRFESYLTLLAFPSAIFGGCYAGSDSVLAAFVITGIIISSFIIAIPLYLRYLRPCPQACPGLENENKEAMRQESAPLYKRWDILAKIQNAFLSGKGVILTSKTGEGKSSLAKSLAELIVSKECHESFNNAVVYSQNANELKGLETVSLKQVEGIFKRHRNNFILFLDEIESLFKEDQFRGKLSDSLLTFQDKIPHLICATTTVQYEKTIQNNEDAFNRRFVRIEVESPTDEEIKIILNYKLHFRAPELMLESGVLDHIIKSAPEYDKTTSKVHAACSLLASAIVKATVLSFDSLEGEIARLLVSQEALAQECIQSEGLTHSEKLKEIQSKLALKKAALEKNKNQLVRLKKIEKICLRMKNARYELASQMMSEDKSNPKTLRKWMINQAGFTILSKYVKEQRKALSLTSGLTKDLVDSLTEGFTLR